MNFKKTAMSLLLAFAFVFTSLPPFHFLFQPMTVSAFDIDDVYTVMVYSDVPITTSTINYNGGNIGPGAYIVVDGVQYPAFCVDPLLPGANLHPDGKYPIKVSGTVMNAKVATVLHNSVPYITKS